MVKVYDSTWPRDQAAERLVTPPFGQSVFAVARRLARVRGGCAVGQRGSRAARPHSGRL